MRRTRPTEPRSLEGFVQGRSGVAATVAGINEQIRQYGIGSRNVFEMVGSTPTDLDQSSRFWRGVRLMLGGEVVRQRVSMPVAVGEREPRTPPRIAQDYLTLTETRRTVHRGLFRLVTTMSYAIERRVNVQDGVPATTDMSGWIADGLLWAPDHYGSSDSPELVARVEQVEKYRRALETLTAAAAIQAQAS